MVVHRIDEYRSAAEILQNRGHVTVERLPDAVGNEGFAVLGAENEMDVESGEGLGHRLGRPFRARVWLLVGRPRGVAPGWHGAPPWGLGLGAPRV